MINKLRTFYILTFTQFFSLIGSRMSTIAVGFKIFDQTGNTSPILLAAFFAEIPGMLFGSFSGLLADRWDRRYVIMVGDAGQAVGSLLLLISFLSDGFQLWHLYAISFLQGVFSEIQNPASEASVVMLVSEDQLDRANGLRALGFPLAGVIAPVVAGLLYSFINVPGIIFIDLATFVVAMAVVVSIELPHPKPSAAGKAAAQNFWSELLAGWRYLAQHRGLMIMTLYLSFIYFLINGPLEMAIPYLKTITQDDLETGLLLGVMNLGAAAGAAVIAIWGKIPHRVHTILITYLMFALMMISYGLSRHPVLLGMSLFCLMFPLPLNGALFSTLLQLKTPPDMQGRVFAATGQLFVLATPFSFLLTAWLVDHVLEPAVGGTAWASIAPLMGDQPGAGMGLLMIIVGLIILATTVVVYLSPTVRELEETLPDYVPEVA